MADSPVAQCSADFCPSGDTLWSSEGTLFDDPSSLIKSTVNPDTGFKPIECDGADSVTWNSYWTGDYQVTFWFDYSAATDTDVLWELFQRDDESSLKF